MDSLGNEGTLNQSWVLDETTMIHHPLEVRIDDHRTDKFGRPHSRHSKLSSKHDEYKAVLTAPVQDSIVGVRHAMNARSVTFQDLNDHGISTSFGRQASKFEDTSEDVVKVEKKKKNKVKPALVDNQSETRNFEDQLYGLVNELTNKVLIHQPDNIYGFLADYLEDKVRIEKRNRKKEKIRSKRKKKAREHGIKDAAITDSSDTIEFHEPRRKPALELPIQSLTDHSESVTHCEFFSRYILTSTVGKIVNIFDWKTGKKKLQIPNPRPVNCFTVIPIEKSGEERIVILIASDDGQVHGWRVRVGNKSQARYSVVIPMHQPNPIRVMKLSPKDTCIATGCCFEMDQFTLSNKLEKTVRGTLKLWDFQSIKNYVESPESFKDDVTHTALRTYRQIVSNTESASKIATPTNGRRTSPDYSDEAMYGITALAFSADASCVLVGFGHPYKKGVEDRKMLALLETKNLKTLWLQNETSFAQIRDIALAPMGTGSTCYTFLVVTEKYATKCLVQETRSNDDDENKARVDVNFPWQDEFTSGENWCGTFCCNGDGMVVGCGARLHIMRSSDHSQAGCYDAHILDIHDVAISEDGLYVATASADNTVKIWHAPRLSESNV